MKRWRRVFIGLGSNLGDRKAHCLNAVKMLDRHPTFKSVAVSSLHETEPEGMTSDNLFLNGVLEGFSSLSARELIALCLDIEKKAGRDRQIQGMDRPLDLDLLYMEGVIKGHGGDMEEITVPHPGIPNRIFVLAPWAEIAPRLYLPVFNKRVSEMLDDLMGATFFDGKVSA